MDYVILKQFIPVKELKGLAKLLNWDLEESDPNKTRYIEVTVDEYGKVQYTINESQLH